MTDLKTTSRFTTRECTDYYLSVYHNFGGHCWHYCVHYCSYLITRYTAISEKIFFDVKFPDSSFHNITYCLHPSEKKCNAYEYSTLYVGEKKEKKTPVFSRSLENCCRMPADECQIMYLHVPSNYEHFSRLFPP